MTFQDYHDAKAAHKQFTRNTFYYHGKSAEVIIAERRLARGAALAAIRALRSIDEIRRLRGLRRAEIAEIKRESIPATPTKENIRKELDEAYAQLKRLRNGPNYKSWDTEYYSACGYDDYMYEVWTERLQSCKEKCAGLSRVLRYLS